jgi:hypothetical protein
MLEGSSEGIGHIHMAISSKGYENVKNSIAFSNKTKNGKIVPLPPITCWDNGSAIFERLQNKNDRTVKTMKWEFEVEESWLPHKTLISNIFGVEKDFVYLGEMAKWMIINWWCQSCFNPLGLKGAYQMGSCGHTFHVGCIQ